MAPETNTNKPSKFTSGEKCLIIHVSLTLFIIVLLLIVYVIHLCIVKHSGDQYFSMSRRSSEMSVPKVWWRVGAVILSGNSSRKLCGCLLVRRRWSLAPAHCVAARADPALASLLPSWALRYQYPKLTETPIDRGVIHSQYNKDDNQNNVGLFEHKDQALLGDFTFNLVAIDKNMLHTGGLTLMSLQLKEGIAGKIMQVVVSPITVKSCKKHVLPITELRPYEFCTTLSPSTGLSLDHGSTLILNSEIKGFFSWGDKHGYFPLVILDISHFKNWIDSLVDE